MPFLEAQRIRNEFHRNYLIYINSFHKSELYVSDEYYWLIEATFYRSYKETIYLPFTYKNVKVKYIMK